MKCERFTGWVRIVSIVLRSISRCTRLVPTITISSTEKSVIAASPRSRITRSSSPSVSGATITDEATKIAPNARTATRIRSRIDSMNVL